MTAPELISDPPTSWPQTGKHPFRVPASVWQGPLVPVALVVTAGIVLDRYTSFPLLFSLITALASLAAWMVTRSSRRTGHPLVYLWIAAGAVGAAYHHWYRDVYPADDIGNYASSDPRPIRLRGVVVEEPTVYYQVHNDPLASMDRADSTVTVLEVTQLRQEHDWVPVSGRTRLIVPAGLPGIHAGDEVEVVGRIAAPPGAANPGELDFASSLRDQRIRAQVQVRKTADGVRRIAVGWPRSLTGWLGVIRCWGQKVLQQALPEYSGVATALLLGQGSTMTYEDWQKYKRTGVIHVLAISGQHLVILGGFLWAVMRVLRVPRRYGAVAVAVFLLAYALLTGWRPAAVRSAVMVCAFCGGIVLRRLPVLANSFALAWLAVGVFNPADLFDTGCLLSFLAVAILYWNTSRWFNSQPDPLDRLVEESRPGWLRLLRKFAGQVALSYAVTIVISLAVSPLLAARFHLVPLIGIVIGPPTVLLTTIALLSGFLLLLTAAVCPPLVPVCAWFTHWSLAGCEFLVNHADRVPGGHWYVPDVAEWWLWVFYVGLLAFLMLEWLRQRARWVALAGLVWVCIGLVVSWARPAPDELRCTFLAVGHGGCTVLETPDGRVLLYDAGAMNGPDVTRRQIAPYLWSRGIRRIDEVFLSHADLDHFNSVPALLDRFAVGQVTCTPTFADKKTPGVPITLAALQTHSVPVRIVRAGDRLSVGAVELEVLHPPAAGPKGNENTRSMVLLVRHAGHAILLTGDLEGAGLERVLTLPLPHVDVLMAPHHGSRAGNDIEVANRTRLAKRVQPGVIVSCQGLPRGSPSKPNPYAASGAPFLGTWPHGAITIRSRREELTVETFQTGQKLMITSR
jgi:competence protein ComEC